MSVCLSELERDRERERERERERGGGERERECVTMIDPVLLNRHSTPCSCVLRPAAPDLRADRPVVPVHHQDASGPNGTGVDPVTLSGEDAPRCIWGAQGWVVNQGTRSLEPVACDICFLLKFVHRLCSIPLQGAVEVESPNDAGSERLSSGTSNPVIHPDWDIMMQIKVAAHSQHTRQS